MFEGQKFGGMKNHTLKKEILTGFTTPSTWGRHVKTLFWSNWGWLNIGCYMSKMSRSSKTPLCNLGHHLHRNFIIHIWPSRRHNNTGSSSFCQTPPKPPASHPWACDHACQTFRDVVNGHRYRSDDPHPPQLLLLLLLLRSPEIWQVPQVSRTWWNTRED